MENPGRDAERGPWKELKREAASPEKGRREAWGWQLEKWKEAVGNPSSSHPSSFFSLPSLIVCFPLIVSLSWACSQGQGCEGHMPGMTPQESKSAKDKVS